jgi:hypothetical protein
MKGNSYFERTQHEALKNGVPVKPNHGMIVDATCTETDTTTHMPCSVKLPTTEQMLI